jgi:acylpyruvate hydrolase
MKIIAVGRNYAEHALELKNDIPDAPIIFLKPDTAVLKDEKPFYLPEHLGSIHHELELVVKINKRGKFIDQAFAHSYYNEIGLGIDFTARDLQSQLKAKGQPWELAKAFDNSAVVGTFVEKSSLGNLANLNLELAINDDTKQSGNTGQMLFNIDYLISFVSKYFTLNQGDLLFTGTPAGVGAVHIGDKLVGYLNNMPLLRVEVK